MGKRTATRRVSAILLGILMLTPANLLSWSVEGHRTIALIAINRLQGTPTAARIKAILGTLTLEDIATCPDEVRDLEQYHAPMSTVCKKIFPTPPKGTANWHFVDIPIKDADFEPGTSDVNTACNNNCSLTQIDHFLNVLSASKSTDKGKKKLQDQQALSYVVHFIGDLHQPLHSSDRNGDRGGNDEHITFFGTDASGKLVLHTIWDKQIVSKIDSDPAKLASDIAPQVSQAASEAPQGKPVDWAIQSYNYARDVAYKGIAPPNGSTDVADLGQPYQDAAAPVVRIQLARAGVRLANALQQALP